jgi:hypothetical protein
VLGTGSSLLSIGRSAPVIQGTSLAHRATTLSVSSWCMSRAPGPWAVVLCRRFQCPLRQPECVGYGELVVYLVRGVAVEDYACDLLFDSTVKAVL